MITGRVLWTVFAVLTAGGCSGDDWPRLLGQTLYNSGKYACTQSSNCDTAGDSPGSASNRR